MEIQLPPRASSMSTGKVLQREDSNTVLLKQMIADIKGLKDSLPTDAYHNYVDYLQRRVRQLEKEVLAEDCQVCDDEIAFPYTEMDYCLTFKVRTRVDTERKRVFLAFEVLSSEIEHEE